MSKHPAVLVERLRPETHRSRPMKAVFGSVDPITYISKRWGGGFYRITDLAGSVQREVMVAGKLYTLLPKEMPS